jgi:hypothetical protein
MWLGFMSTVSGQPLRAMIINLSESEKDVLINLSGQLVEILAERVDEAYSDPMAKLIGITGHDSPPDDEVLLRLLPNAYADPVYASEFRRYTESDLRGKKSQHAMHVRSQLMELEDGSVMLDSEGALAWLGALNDIRLALGVRLKVDGNSHERHELLSPEDPMHSVFAVYSWLGWLQESLVLSLMEDFNEAGGHHEP